MPPTQEQKRRMRTDRKKRKRLQRREYRKAKHEERQNARTEVALTRVKEKADHNKELASKYFALLQRYKKQQQVIAKQLGRKRETVAVLDINDAKGKILEKNLKDEFGDDMACYAHCNVTDKHQLKDVFENVKRRFNGLQIIVNNAGVANPDCDIVVDVNLKAVIRGTTLGIELMDRNSGNNGGAIINISSFSGIIPMSHGPVYTATKAGVVAFTRCFKMAAPKNGVRVNCICPVFVKGTDMFNEALETMAEMRPIAERLGVVTVDLVAEAVIKTIEDNTLAGNVVTVTKDRGIQKHAFPKAKI